MTTLKAEKRDMSVKAKALRRQGKITGNVYGKEMKEAIPIQFDATEASRFLKAHAKGSQAILELDGKNMNVLLKDMSYDPTNHIYNDVNFQALVEGEKVHSTAPVILLNEDQMKGFLTHNLTEVAYKAAPSALIEKIEIDLSTLAIGTNLLVGDLDIAKNKDIDLITPADTSILHIAEHQKNGVMTDDAEAETVEA